MYDVPFLLRRGGGVVRQVLACATHSEPDQIEPLVHTGLFEDMLRHKMRSIRVFVQVGLGRTGCAAPAATTIETISCCAHMFRHVELLGSQS